MTITLNGNLTDWTADDRLETPGTLTANYEVYGRVEAGNFYFALRSAVAIGAGTTFWLNTDNNKATGQLVFGEVGAEYYVNIDADNIARLYTGANVLVGTVVTSRSADNLILELSIPKASIGNVSSVIMSADVNNSVYLHQPYSSGGYTLSDPAVQPFDGKLTEWTSAQRLDTAGDLPVGNELYGKVANGEFVFGLKSTTVIGSGTTFWLNTDGNTATGYQVFGNTGGAEYNVDIGVDGVAKLYSGSAGQTFIGNISYKVAFDGLSMEFSVPKTLIGGATSVTVLTDVSNTSFLPGSYSSGGFTVIDNSVNPYDGLLTEWTHADRLETPITTITGLELYGKFTAGVFNFAVKSDVVIGPNTTFWFNTDGNAATGETSFGGAEYHINIDAQGVARLYSGPNEATPLGAINFAFSTDHKTLEFGLPQSLIGTNVSAVTMLGDINQSVFFPTSYTLQQPYTVIDPATLPAANHAEHRIAILYSDSTAANYFNTMAYSQLFMAAQSQAMAAGVPYDIVTEADLKNLTKMAAYDTIIFPSFTNVKAADVVAIQDVLTKLVYQYDVSLITAGNFMTTDEHGTVLADSYTRMQLLFGVTADGSATAASVDLKAHGTTSITAGYGGDGAEIHTYVPAGTATTVGTSYYKAMDNVVTTVIADQIVGGTSHAAVIGTDTGSRNVHFATDGFMADNNLLGQAIDWVNEETAGPTVSLEMTRNSSIVAARVDMDQAKEQVDVDGGIYTKLIGILDQWKTAYNFVGSYYIDLGNDPADDQGTNWLISKVYYDHMVAAGNEIGSHSYTHPENTNFLAGATLTDAQLADIKASGPVDINGVRTSELYFPGLSTVTTAAQYNSILATALAAPDPSVLGVEARAVLDSSFKFQFETARAVIEAHMGPITGAAVPGAPESLETARQIMQYYDYLTGGAALTGAGYPGAFGYLSPTDASKVYIAPNTSFDFTMLGFQNLTLAQAAAKWAAEFSSLNVNSDVPIVVWPWHDYGPTAWPLDEGVASPYTQGLFDQFIQTAYNAGSEFVTLADLAARIKAFQQSTFGFSVAGDTITMHAVPQTGTLGTFALNLDDLAGKVIASVTNWYAYDDNSVFLDADGGTFVATLGTVATDVTHITSIGARAQLVTLTGDGTSLAFTVAGEGKVVVDVKAAAAGFTYHATGATVVSQVGDIMTLDLGAIASHSVTVRQADFWGTEGNDTIAGSATNNIIRGEGGNDTILGSAGADLIDGGAGSDTVSYVGSTEAISINLLLNVAHGGNAEGDTFTFIENIIGGSGNDTLIGDAGNNRLDGGAGGNDILTGGAGDDRFVYRSSGRADVITDFSNTTAHDKIDFNGLGLTYRSAMALATQQGANTVFNFGSGNTLTLQNVNKASLQASDFLGVSATHRDFNHDGMSDILLRSAAGTVVGWDMNSATVTKTNVISTMPSNWSISGTGDFNGDGKADILLRSAAGTVVGWNMDDGKVIATNVISTMPSNWSIAGTGDFNGDGKSDILLRSAAGTVVGWNMNDGKVIATNVISTMPSNWSIAGTGDFNGDGKADILLRSAAGTVVGWNMNDDHVIATNVISTMPSNWSIAGTGDFNGDGKSDILLRSAAGTVVAWNMDNDHVIATNVISTIPSDWLIA